MRPDKGNPKVQYQTAFGAEQLTLSDNRPNLQAETLFFLQNAVAFKTYQLVIDEAIWLLTPLVYVRTVAGLYWAYLINPAATTFLLALPVLMLLPSFAFLWAQASKTHGAAIALRVLLLIGGIALGFV